MKSKLIGTSIATIALVALAGCASTSEQSIAEACQIINSNTESIKVVDAQHIEDLDKGVTNTEVKDAFGEIKTFMLQAADGTLDEADTTKYQEALVKFENLCYSDTDNNGAIVEEGEETFDEQSGNADFIEQEEVITEQSSGIE